MEVPVGVLLTCAGVGWRAALLPLVLRAFQEQREGEEHARASLHSGGPQRAAPPTARAVAILWLARAAVLIAVTVGCAVLLAGESFWFFDDLSKAGRGWQALTASAVAGAFAAWNPLTAHARTRHLLLGAGLASALCLVLPGGAMLFWLGFLVAGPIVLWVAGVSPKATRR